MAQPVQTDEASVTRPPLSRKRRQTQEKLLDAALDAFAERGFHGASVEEICERAGFSRGAFYSNYSSKTELFIALYHRAAAATLKSLNDRTTPESHAPGRDISEIVADMMTNIPHDRRWYLINAEFALHAVRNPAAAATLAAARRQARTNFAVRITRVVAQMGRKLTVPVDDVVRWLFALNEGGVAQAYLEPHMLQPHDLTRQVTPYLLAAVSVPLND
jgi:AcrR family transcriptional regulator